MLGREGTKHTPGPVQTFPGAPGESGKVPSRMAMRDEAVAGVDAKSFLQADYVMAQDETFRLEALQLNVGGTAEDADRERAPGTLQRFEPPLHLQAFRPWPRFGAGEHKRDMSEAE